MNVIRDAVDYAELSHDAITLFDRNGAELFKYPGHFEWSEVPSAITVMGKVVPMEEAIDFEYAPDVKDQRNV